jgi:hypothetical protein
VEFDPHDEEAGPGLVHGQDHPLVTHLLQLSVLHNLNLQPNNVTNVIDCFLHKSINHEVKLSKYDNIHTKNKTWEQN